MGVRAGVVVSTFDDGEGEGEVGTCGRGIAVDLVCRSSTTERERERHRDSRHDRAAPVSIFDDGEGEGECRRESRPNVDAGMTPEERQRIQLKLQAAERVASEAIRQEDVGNQVAACNSWRRLLGPEFRF